MDLLFGAIMPHLLQVITKYMVVTDYLLQVITNYMVVTDYLLQVITNCMVVTDYLLQVITNCMVVTDLGRLQWLICHYDGLAPRQRGRGRKGEGEW